MNKLKFLAIFAPLFLSTVAVQAYIQYQENAISEYSYITPIFFILVYIFYSQLILTIEKTYPRTYWHLLSFSISLAIVMAIVDYTSSTLVMLSSLVYFAILGSFAAGWALIIYSLKASQLASKHKQKMQVSYWKNKINGK